MISSTSNPTIKRVRRLRKRLWRERKGLLLVEGHRAVDAAIDAGATVHEVFHTSSAERLRGSLLEEARRRGAVVRAVTPEVMAHLTSVSTAPDVLAIAPLMETTLTTIEHRSIAGVILAGVRDPATVGGILATAAAAGCTGAIATHGTADLYRAKTVRSGRGAHFRLALVRDVSDAAAVAAATAGGSRVVSLGRDGTPPWDLDLRGPLVVRVEGEGAGPSPDDAGERIALPADGAPPSLAASAAVVLYEWVRQGGVG